MPKKLFTDEEARERKNARQREYAKQTGYKGNIEYNKRTYVQYALKLRKVEDSDIIDIIENEKSKGYGTSDAIKRLIKKS